MHTHTHMDTCARYPSLADTHMHAHTRTRSSDAYTLSCTHAQTHECISTHSHMRTHMRTHLTRVAHPAPVQECLHSARQQPMRLLLQHARIPHERLHHAQRHQAVACCWQRRRVLPRHAGQAGRATWGLEGRRRSPTCLPWQQGQHTA